VIAVGPPAAPTNLRASARGRTITVAWNRAVAKGTPVTGYSVRCTRGARDFTASPGAGATSARVQVTVAGAFACRVVARSAAGNSPAAGPANVTVR
jgi:hypothetical protein